MVGLEGVDDLIADLDRALVHAVAHIEFNAINLALDVIWRFEGIPLAYYV